MSVEPLLESRMTGQGLVARPVVNARRAWLAWGWTALILVLCWTPGRWLPVHEPGTGGGPAIQKDKLVHFTMFAVFGTLWMRAVRTSRGAGTLLVSGLAFAAVTELGQDLPFIGRDGDVYDALADSTGLVVAVGVWLAWIAWNGRGRWPAQGLEDPLRTDVPPGSGEGPGCSP
jgi:VanZ family protein